MDIQLIAAGAMAVLSPFLIKAGGAFAEEAGKALAEIAGALLQTVKRKFAGDAYAEQTLARLEDKPESVRRQGALEDVLVEKMEEDIAFAEEVHRSLEASRMADTQHVIAFGVRSVAVGGDLSDSTVTTGDGNVVGNGSRSQVI